MTGNDAMMVSSGDDQEKAVPPWWRPIASAKFYSPCEVHPSEDRNFYCNTCMITLCKECKSQCNHSRHETIQAFKIGRNALVKMEDLKSLWDVSDIRPYTFNDRLVATVYKRGAEIARSRGQSNAMECKSCQHRFKSSGTKYCSIECKVEAVMKMNESGNMKKEAKRKVETIAEESASNGQSFRKCPRNW